MRKFDEWSTPTKKQIVCWRFKGRGDLDQERMVIESNLSRNVRKIDSTLNRMEGMRDQKNKFASEVRAVAKRLTYEKDCVEQRLLFEKQVFSSVTFPSILYFVGNYYYIA